MPRVKPFRPTKWKWIIINNRFYDKLRQVGPFSKFADIDQADQDAQNVRNHIIALGANPADIVMMSNVSFNDLKGMKNDLQAMLHLGSKAGEKTAIVIYYAGHGM